MSLTPGNWLSLRRLAVLFIRDMGNYSQNRIIPATVLIELRKNAPGIQFTGYHWRPSGNFLFVHDRDSALLAASNVGEEVTKLPCLVRTAAEIEALIRVIPNECEETPQGSVILKRPEGTEKVIWVGLSRPITEHERIVGRINNRSSIFCWSSGTDVLCFYDRPKHGGDVGQVTTAVMRTLGGQTRHLCNGSVHRPTQRLDERERHHRSIVIGSSGVCSSISIRRIEIKEYALTFRLTAPDTYPRNNLYPRIYRGDSPS